MAIVWPCDLPVEAYAAAGREVEFPRPDCLSCLRPMTFWSGYLRHVRAGSRCQRIFVPRLRCGRCRVSHALLPAFVLAWRLDAVEAIGTVIAGVAGGAGGVRPEIGIGFAALAVELGGEAVRPAAYPGRFGLAAIGAAFGAACALPGWLAAGQWRFVSSVTGGRLIAANITSPYLIIGRRRFMPPIPPLPA